MADRDINKAKESVYDAANKIGGAAQSQYEQTKSAAKDATGTAQDKTHSFLGTAQVTSVEECMIPVICLEKALQMALLWDCQ